MSESERIERLADALIGALPKLDRREQTMAVALLRLLAKGTPVSDQALAAASGASEEKSRDALASWPGVFATRTAGSSGSRA
jgi:alkylmercury lyase-like protein